MARKTTVKAFESWVADEGNVEAVLEHIRGGLTLQQASIMVKQPFTCLHTYFHSTPERETQYLTARKSWVDLKNDQLLEKVEQVPADRDHVAKLKLESEVLATQSKSYYRDRWGERIQVEKNVNVQADAALIGTISQLLLSAKKRSPVTIDSAPGQVADASRDIGAEPPSVRLPAPAELK